jgi:uncharacterized RDD family membrane protein YckC
MTTDTPAAPASTPSEKVTGRRVAAGLIDLVILVALFWVFGKLFGTAESSDGTVSVNLSGLGALAYAIVSLAYFVVLESRTGQTLGKKAMGIRVVSEETGAPPSTGRAVGRTLLRVIDGLFLYLVGLITIAVSKKDQRIGDMAANTLVVRA